MRRLALVVLLFAAHSVFADSIFEKLDKFYTGAGFNYIDANTPDASGNGGSFRMVELIGGYKYNGFLGAELRVGVGTGGDTFGTADNPVDSTIDYTGSLYWRPETANEVAKIYGLLGVSTVSITNETIVSESSGSESGVSYGGGFGFVFSEDWNLNFEYRSIIDKSALELTTLSANVDYRF